MINVLCADLNIHETKLDNEDLILKYYHVQYNTMPNEINGYIVIKRRTHHRPSLADTTREVKDRLVKYLFQFSAFCLAQFGAFIAFKSRIACDDT